MRQGNFSWIWSCAAMLTVLLGSSTAQAGRPCTEPSAEATFPPVTLQQVAQGLHEPVHIAVAPGDSGRLYVVEQAGVVRIIERGQLRPEPFLDMRGRVVTQGELLRMPHAVSSFGQDENLELYLADHPAGKIFRIMSKP